MLICELTEAALKPGAKRTIFTWQQDDKPSHKFIPLGRKSPLLRLARSLDLDPKQDRDLSQLGMMTLVWNQIRASCSQSLAAIRATRRPLWRGASGPAAYWGQPWQRRRPDDTSRDQQDLIDQFLEQAGFAARRGNSIFATSNFSQASGYGQDIFYIFPVDGAAITWNRRVRDFYSDVVEDQTVQEYLRQALSSGKGPKPPDLFVIADKLSDQLFPLEEMLSYLEFKGDNVNLSRWLDKVIDGISTFDERLALAGEKFDIDDNPRPLQQLLTNPKFFELLATVNSAQVAQMIPAKLRDRYSQAQTQVKRIIKFVQANQAAIQSAVQSFSMQSYKPKQIQAAAKRLGFVSGDLAGALRSGHEIYINGTYIAVGTYAFDEGFGRILDLWIKGKIR